MVIKFLLVCCFESTFDNIFTISFILLFLEYTNHNGKKETLSSIELEERMNLNDLGVKYEDGNLAQEKSGTETIKSLKKSNPDLAYFISIGQWTRDQLISQGHVIGNITNLRSLPLGGTTSNNNDIILDTKYPISSEV